MLPYEEVLFYSLQILLTMFVLVVHRVIGNIWSQCDIYLSILHIT